MGKETKSFLVWLAASAAIMLALPGLIVTLVNSGSGMAVCLLLFFAINPAKCETAVEPSGSCRSAVPAGGMAVLWLGGNSISLVCRSLSCSGGRGYAGFLLVRV